MTRKIRVGVNGYGAIGKRVADAVRAQADMELIGVADVATDYRFKAAVALNLKVYAATLERAEPMRRAGLPLSGALPDLLKQIDVIVDATPEGLGVQNLATYRAAGVRVVFQGGEQHAAIGHSFVAQANYKSALGRDVTRVVSGDTTAAVRVLGALAHANLMIKARGVLIRRAADPWEAHIEGIMNTLVPGKLVPSRQSAEIKSVLPESNVMTLAAKAAEDLSQCHFWFIELAPHTTREQVIAAFRGAPRIAWIREQDDIAALNSTLVLMKDLGRPRGDMWEVAIWRDILTVRDDELFLVYQVDNQAIVVPETIDAIRAITGIESDAQRSIEKTDRALGVTNEFLPLVEEVLHDENTAAMR